MDIASIPPDKLKEFAKVMGARGGQETFKRYGSEHFKKIRKLSRGRAKYEPKIGT